MESTIRLFADDCVIYRKIINNADMEKLQKDLDRLGEWGRVYGADGAVRLESHGTIRTVQTTYAAVLKTTTHPKLGAENHMLQLNS